VSGLLGRLELLALAPELRSPGLVWGGLLGRPPEEGGGVPETEEEPLK